MDKNRIPLDLFARAQTVGVFRGFTEAGLEFHADLVLPYRNDFQTTPMHGQFLLVQLESPQEAVLGRIASFSSEGKLSSGYGEEFNIRALRDDRPVPEDLREQYLKYRINIRVLGVVRIQTDGSVGFVASHRRLPHVGSPVAFASPELLKELAGHNSLGAAIGHFALGEFVYAAGAADFKKLDWMQVLSPEVQIRFPVESLVSRRTFIFARAGFGKSNLNKLLFSKLYETTPTVTKNANRQVPVGTIIFDPDGEYFWPDDKGRPGLCDVPHLEQKLVLFTPRRSTSPFYQSFVAGGIKLDIRRLRPSDVIAIALDPERQEQQNVRKLKALDPSHWENLVNLIDTNGNAAPLDDVCDILGLEKGGKQEAEALAARGNMTAIVRMLHDRSSQMMDMLIHSLSQGKLCVVDLSQMRGSQSLILSGLILRRIFDRNQQEFTSATPRTIPTIAVVEEAQTVLGERSTSAEPYIAWVKEGRKYDLGALLVTQQPGSIPIEILSQGDNWFVFHLLSASDLYSVSKANAHFSNDLLSTLLNEPIPGQGVFWSSVAGKSYPVPIRVSSFEDTFAVRDSKYVLPAGKTYAKELCERFSSNVNSPSAPPQGFVSFAETTVDPRPEELLTENEGEIAVPDVKASIEQRAVDALRANQRLIQKINSATGASWGEIVHTLEGVLPDTLEDRNKFAYELTPKALTMIFGPRNSGWHSFKNPSNKTSVKTGSQA